MNTHYLGKNKSSHFIDRNLSVNRALFQKRSSFIEKPLCISLLAIVFTTCFVSLYQSNRYEKAFPVKKIHVWIQGEVKKPGQYEFVEGSPLKELLFLAKPLKYALIDEGMLNRILKDEDCIEIERRAAIQCKIHGAVAQPDVYFLPIGTRICDLKKIVVLQKNADKKFFKSKRLISNNESIKIPFESK